MAKSKKSNILAMALCASVMAGIYASPVMAAQTGLSGTVSENEVTIKADSTVTINGVKLSGNDISAVDGAFTGAVSGKTGTFSGALTAGSITSKGAFSVKDADNKSNFTVTTAGAVTANGKITGNNGMLITATSTDKTQTTSNVTASSITNTVKAWDSSNSKFVNSASSTVGKGKITNTVYDSNGKTATQISMSTTSINNSVYDANNKLASQLSLGTTSAALKSGSSNVTVNGSTGAISITAKKSDGTAGAFTLSSKNFAVNASEMSFKNTSGEKVFTLASSGNVTAAGTFTANGKITGKNGSAISAENNANRGTSNTTATTINDTVTNGTATSSSDIRATSITEKVDLGTDNATVQTQLSSSGIVDTFTDGSGNTHKVTTNASGTKFSGTGNAYDYTLIDGKSVTFGGSASAAQGGQTKIVGGQITTDKVTTDEVVIDAKNSWTKDGLTIDGVTLSTKDGAFAVSALDIENVQLDKDGLKLGKKGSEVFTVDSKTGETHINGATGSFNMRDIEGNTMIYTKANDEDGTNTIWIDPLKGNISTIGTVGVGNDLSKPTTQIQGSGENVGDIAVGIQYDGDGNITGQNIVLDASTGDIISKGTLSGNGLAAEGVSGGLYVSDVAKGKTMIYTKDADGKNTMWIDPATGNLSTVGTISVGGELGGQAKTVIDGATGDIAVGITGNGTQMIHLDASTGSITAANFNGVTLATNGEKVLVGGYDISQMDDTLETVGGDVGVLRTDVNQLRTDVGVLRKDVGDLRTDVNRNTKDIGTLRVDVGTISSNLNTLTDRVQAVEDKTQGISYDESTGTTTVDGNLNVNGDVTATGDANTGEGGNIGAGGNVSGDTGTIGGVGMENGNIAADTGTIGGVGMENGNIAANTGTIGGVGMENGNIAADTGTIGGVGMENGNIAANTGTIGGVGMENGNISANTGTIGDVTMSGGKVTAGQTTVSNDGVSIADKTIINDHDVVINSGTENEVSLSDVGNRVDNLEQGVSELNNRVGELEDRIDKVGAMAAAIANLRTMGYDPAAPTEVAVGIGQYRDETGAALGLFHYPNRDFMLSLSASTSGDEVMGGIGATWKFGRKSPEKVAEIKKAQAEADVRRAEAQKLEKAEAMKQAAKEAKIKAQQERHAKLAAERAAQAEAAK